MGIYTKTGDKGETSLYGGSRVAKDSLRVWCYGSVDEANSVLGIIHASLTFPDLKEIVREIQRKMFIIGAQLASDEQGHEKLAVKIQKDDVRWLEGIIDRCTEEYGGFSGFTIPGETPVSAYFHMARTVVRRSERHCVTLSREEFVCPLVTRYLNRLSDTLYILAKVEIYKSFIQKVMDRIYEVTNTAAPKTFSMDPMNPALFEKLSQAAEEESQLVGIGVSLSIVDESGTLAYFKRFPNAIGISVSVSQNKAYTAAVMKMPTGDLAALAAPGGSLYGLSTADPRIIIFGGGFPLCVQGRQVGAIGISGGSVEQDEQIARRVLAVFQELTGPIVSF